MAKHVLHLLIPKCERTIAQYFNYVELKIPCSGSVEFRCRFRCSFFATEIGRYAKDSRLNIRL